MQTLSVPRRAPIIGGHILAGMCGLLALMLVFFALENLLGTGGLFGYDFGVFLLILASTCAFGCIAAASAVRRYQAGLGGRALRTAGMIVVAVSLLIIAYLVQTVMHSGNYSIHIVAWLGPFFVLALSGMVCATAR